VLFGGPPGRIPLAVCRKKAHGIIGSYFDRSYAVTANAAGLQTYRDTGGWLSYNSPEYLKERYGLPPDLTRNLAVMETLAATAAEYITRHENTKHHLI
jgi:hypothetical protein